MVTVDGEFAAVPTDGWGQMIVYRADWFEENGLNPPDTYENIMTAAEALTDLSNNIWGITAATDGGAVFTQQTFEHVALANGCQLVDDQGNVSLNTPECVEAVQFFDKPHDQLQSSWCTRCGQYQSDVFCWTGRDDHLVSFHPG